MNDKLLPNSRDSSAEVWNALADLRESRVDLEAGRQRLAAKLAQHERLSHIAVPPSFRQRVSAISRTTITGVTLGILALVAVVSGIQKIRATSLMNLKTSYATRNGQRAEIILADDTHVTLNVASRIDVPQNFGEDNRTIRLNGEAYFRVVHARSTPFVVEAGSTRTTVLGTAFEVRAYHPNDIRVAVRDGRVALGRTVLGARDVATVTNGDEVAVTHDSQELENILSFTTGQLVLKDRPLKDALPDLERWYNVEIRLADPGIGKLPISLVAADTSVTDLVNVLQPILDVRVVRTGRTLTLYTNR